MRGDASPVRQSLEQRGKALVGLAEHRIVDPGQGADVLQPHLALEIGAAEDGDEMRIAFFEQTRQRQRRAFCTKTELKPTTSY